MCKWCHAGAVTLALTAVGPAHGQRAGDRIFLEHADQIEIVQEAERYLTYVVGNVHFRTATGDIYCDSAVWKRRAEARLLGNVLIDDRDYRLAADSVHYDILADRAIARGANVELWSYDDSLFAVGTHAYFDNLNDFFYMEERPLLYLQYPDSARMVEVNADRIQYDKSVRRAEASGNVIITSQDIESSSQCAVMKLDDDVLDLFGNPNLQRGRSKVAGDLISILFENDTLRTIDVIDSATGEFVEPIDSAETDFDRSTLKGNRLILGFKNNELHNVLCYGQAYSWYYPSARGSNELNENSVSGDTIRFTVRDNKLTRVDVVGGAIGTFLTGELVSADTSRPAKVDTIDYRSEYIHYNVADSVITLIEAGHVESGTVSLDAHEIEFDTEQRLIEAFSAEIDTATSDSSTGDSDAGRPDAFTVRPNRIPVILRDREEEVLGNYLEYSIDTEKGRIVQSKSEYEAGYYYGSRLFREQKHIFYVHSGRYTTCDLDEPHYHFQSSNMKLIEGDKLIAKPVVFYIGRIPILAIPYYVFPLKKGRHSGFLPFTFGRFERGERYVRNVGYYWAASEYWDWRGSFDYIEESRTFIFNSAVNFNKRYVVDGNISGSYTRVAGFNRLSASETRSNRWIINTVYNHNVTPNFRVSGSGSFQSDKSYYTDYSSNLDERINRNVKSQVTFRKTFGKSTSLSGSFTHNVDLDRESRSDVLPTAALSLPTIYPFGNGTRDAQGNPQQKWYHNFTLRYTPNLRHVSNRVTVDSTFSVGFDTTIVIDSMLVDTTWVFTEDTTITELRDTISYRSRRRYINVSHNPSIGLPTVNLLKYLRLTPSINYRETWIKVFETDQSRQEGIDASQLYRTYSFSSGVSMATAVYGTVYPRVLGLEGLRHVVEPTVSYSYAPEIDKHPGIRSFAGGGAGSRKSSVMSFSLRQTFQAKTRKGEFERDLTLLILSSGLSYNFELDKRPLSNLRTTFQTSTIPNVQLSGNLTHDLYRPDTTFLTDSTFTVSDKLDLWHPQLTNFGLDLTFNLSGRRFFFDDDVESIPRGTPTAADLPQDQTSAPTGWRLSATYHYDQSGVGNAFSKRSFVRFNLSFNLTPSTSVNYSQQYDIVGDKTVNSQVRINRTIHCWQGSLWWVPTGSNRGFGFRLNVTALPEIKIDQNFDTFDSGLLKQR